MCYQYKNSVETPQHFSKLPVLVFIICSADIDSGVHSDTLPEIANTNPPCHTRCNNLHQGSIAFFYAINPPGRSSRSDHIDASTNNWYIIYSIPYTVLRNLKLNPFCSHNHFEILILPLTCGTLKTWVKSSLCLVSPWEMKLWKSACSFMVHGSLSFSVGIHHKWWIPPCLIGYGNSSWDSQTDWSKVKDDLTKICSSPPTIQTPAN